MPVPHHAWWHDKGLTWRRPESRPLTWQGLPRHLSWRGRAAPRRTAHGAAVPVRLTTSTVPRAWNCATRRGHAPIHLLRPLPRPVPPMNFAPATTPSLHGIELCAGVELRVDEPFATGCFTRFRCVFHVFSLSTAAHTNHRNDWSSVPPYTPLTLIIGESIVHKHSWTRGVAPKQLIGYIRMHSSWKFIRCFRLLASSSLSIFSAP